MEGGMGRGNDRERSRERRDRSGEIGDLEMDVMDGIECVVFCVLCCCVVLVLADTAHG